MKFLAPLGFAFAAALPVVVLFYLLKRKRVTRLVPSTVLWQRFLAETQASAPLQRLRHNWLLLLQLLLLALVVLALARPYFRGTVGRGGLQVVVLDASASMQATDESPSRFERARAQVLQLVDALGSTNTEQMAILVAGANTEVKQSKTANKAALRRAVESARVTDSPTRLAEALRVAESLVRGESAAEVHLFSDGAVPDLAQFEARDLRLVFHRVGRRADNVGLVSLDVKPNPEDPAKRALFASVVNYRPEPVEAQLELLFDGVLIEARPLTLAATNTTPVVFVAAQPRDGVFTVRLDVADDLAADNEASIVSVLPPPVRVLLVTPGNGRLERALRVAAPAIEVVTAADHTGAEGAFDVVVLDEVTPRVWPAGNTLAIFVASTNWFDGPVGQLEAPPIVDWRNTHPLLRFVSFDTVQIARSLAVTRPPWGVPLVESPNAPLILAGELGRQRLVWIAFPTLESTWPLRISFPIFIANAVEWLNPAAARAEQFLLRPGDAFRLPLAEPVALARVTAPGGEVTEVPLGPDAKELVFGDTARRGVYQVELGTNRVRFAASLLDAAESNLKPRETLVLGRYQEVAATAEKRANLEYWRWFALGALGVMMVEWWWFHRRTA
jgi:Ca-activated chloride channel homolog